MSNPAAPVTIGKTSTFDLGQVFSQIAAHPVITGVILVFLLLLWVLRPGGFGGLVLDYLKHKREMNEKAEDRRERLFARYQNIRPLDQPMLSPPPPPAPQLPPPVEPPEPRVRVVRSEDHRREE